MFTDMVGYTALSQRNEALALELLEEHRRLLRALFPRHNGTEIKTIGDAFLVEFQSALEAAQCAIEIQRTLAKRNADAPAERRIQARVDIHIGDVIHREGDVYGDGVNIASRIEPLAGAGGICISMDVERQIRHALEASLVKLPPTELKNIQVPMDLFRIVLPWEKGALPIAERASASHRRSPTLVALGVGMLLVLAGATWLWFRPFGKSGSTTGGPTTPAAAPAGVPGAPAINTLAVLPFEDRSSDKAGEHLSDGITEELINTLQNVSGLRVQGRAASFYFKGTNESLQKIGEQLHVSYLLEGSVSQDGNKLRVTADLISAVDGFQLWATNYDRDLSDIFAIRSDVAQQVATALRIQLGVDVSQSLGRKPTENIEA